MIDMDTKKLMEKCNKIWKLIAMILDDESTSYADGCNLMLTINARYLNGFKKIEGVGAPELKKLLRDEYIKLLDEKLDD
jgi:hypothetical protein